MLLQALSAAAILLMQAGAAPATAPAPPAAAAASAAKPVALSNDDAMVCRQIVYTGTRFSNKECHTAREWKQMATDASDYQKYVDRRANGFCLMACGN